MRAWLDELAAWWAALPPEWVLLLLLPFLVGAVGLLAQWPVTDRHGTSRNTEDAKGRRGRRKYL
jgi:hypothetical protein